jgi:hypothetical protein
MTESQEKEWVIICKRRNRVIAIQDDHIEMTIYSLSEAEAFIKVHMLCRTSDVILLNVETGKVIYQTL